MRTDPFRDPDRWTQSVSGSAARPATMPMDAYRKNDTFVVHLELPGVTPDSIDLTVEQNVLTIRAERKPPETEDVEKVVDERAYGVFSRQLLLGETLDTEKLAAGYADGVLTLTIPIAEPAEPRRIAVNIGSRGQGIGG